MANPILVCYSEAATVSSSPFFCCAATLLYVVYGRTDHSPTYQHSPLDVKHRSPSQVREDIGLLFFFRRQVRVAVRARYVLYLSNAVGAEYYVIDRGVGTAWTIVYLTVSL